jgi:opacity protein-like surface antigen
MRNSTLLLLLNLTCLASFGQFNIYYDFTRPLGAQGKNISTAHGINFGYEHRLKKSPFLLGGEIGFNHYGLKTVEKELPFHNGYVTKTDVHYSTSFTTYSVNVKLQPETKKLVKPYGLIRMGMLNYHSNMTIDDPEDPQGCKVLEKKVLVKDLTWMASAGGGTSFDWKVFNPKTSSSLQVDLGLLYTVGGNAEYLKMKKPSNEVDEKGRLYYVNFEHIPTGEVHDHPVGSIYNTMTSMLTIRLGIRFLLD